MVFIISIKVNIPPNPVHIFTIQLIVIKGVLRFLSKFFLNESPLKRVLRHHFLQFSKSYKFALSSRSYRILQPNLSFFIGEIFFRFCFSLFQFLLSFRICFMFSHTDRTVKKLTFIFETRIIIFKF